MPRKDRLRRVVLLCCAFARNLAYHRVGQEPEFKDLLDPKKDASANFWIIANGNSIDMCVLEWCKLFADEKGKHYWGQIVANPDQFKRDLLARLGLDDDGLNDYISDMRRYRDKFLAHLDSEYTMNIPKLDIAKESVWFYHSHIVKQEASKDDLTGLATDLDRGYEQSEKEARAVFEK